MRAGLAPDNSERIFCSTNCCTRLDTQPLKENELGQGEHLSQPEQCPALNHVEEEDALDGHYERHPTKDLLQPCRIDRIHFWEEPVGSALEDSQLSNLTCNGRNHLHCRGSGSNDTNLGGQKLFVFSETTNVTAYPLPFKGDRVIPLGCVPAGTC